MSTRAVVQKRQHEESAPQNTGPGKSSQATGVGLPLFMQANPTASAGITLQRKCACGGTPGANDECETCNSGKFLQPKLAIGASDDPLEQEADRVADQVLAMPANSTVSAAPLPIQRYTGQATAATGTVPASVDRVLADSGKPLDPALRQDMEQRFGHDFSKVRVHSSAASAQSARDVNAHAYTVGHNIVFGAGRFSSATLAGKRLLAHELTHVVQQEKSRDSNLIQRAEVDDRSCTGLMDIKSDINTEVNAGISAARSAAASPMVVADFLEAVSSRLGGRFVGAIETFIQNMATNKRTDPKKDLSNTKFKGVSNRFYLLHTIGAAKVVGPAAMVNGICVGADKFGHFFGEGFTYFTVAKAAGGGAAGTAAAESTGRFLEISDKQGLGVTGVFSNADLAANLAGKQFYEDLEANPSKFTFSVDKYISTNWNERINPSFYASNEAKEIWSNLLTGSWDGEFTSGGGSSSPINATVDLVATTTSSVTGTNSWPAGGIKPNKEKIKNGKIIERVTSVSGTFPSSPSQTLSEKPVSGITIEFDWELGKGSGKGIWTSVDEQNLVGTWGIGSSRTSGGIWKLKKT